MRNRVRSLAGLLLVPSLAWGGGGPLGIDHRLAHSDSGPWKRSIQVGLEDAVILTELVGLLSTSRESRLGETFRRDLDATVLTAVTTVIAKRAFARARPDQTDNPDSWFQGAGHESFPSGEVALQASFVTPFIAEYHADHPWVWLLEVLPAFDAVARLKAQGHWQTDVLAGWALGTAWGLYAHNRTSPLFVSLIPHGVAVGYRARF